MLSAELEQEMQRFFEAERRIWYPALRKSLTNRERMLFLSVVAGLPGRLTPAVRRILNGLARKGLVEPPEPRLCKGMLVITNKTCEFQATEMGLAVFDYERYPDTPRRAKRSYL